MTRPEYLRKAIAELAKSEVVDIKIYKKLRQELYVWEKSPNFRRVISGKS